MLFNFQPSFKIFGSDSAFFLVLFQFGERNAYRKFKKLDFGCLLVILSLNITVGVINDGLLPIYFTSSIQ